MPVRNRFAELHDEITAWRHDFHTHPELMFDTHRTAARVAALLTAMGCDEVATGIGRTGVVGVIHGRNGASGKVIGLRADMDALPITEATGAAYASSEPGKMHACGHDGHSSMLLGAAKYLAETRNFDGTAVVIFQPAEEGGGGGREMVEDGLMDRFGIDEVYALHNLPGLPVGQFAIRPGAIMAAADEFHITVTGRGGHAAKPQATVDTTLVASHIVVALQSIVSRNTDPLREAVLTVSAFHTDSTAYNVIPQTAVLRGTVRSMDETTRDLIVKRLHEVAQGIAASFGARAEVSYNYGYPVTVNASEQTEFAAEVARGVAGEIDTEADPMMAAEDFSYMLNARPGAYIFLGNGDSAMLHHPEYDFADEAIPYGCSWFASLIEQRMPLG
ncbi:M20 aminoacylase family protein [Actibacterium sp. XHP0104]|uniref:M20 aminoacylase family protein n=1 Tax=Actibacterium sp. XHP0104 TaxID=2984335 RepID=UPI0021E7F016|nr:M20 aminoacylase family protein [Actibacterium sp. XHP0104]MCV2881369.1 M20 family metallopeptidase [Actibacterium sp. XHP0104]